MLNKLKMKTKLNYILSIIASIAILGLYKWLIDHHIPNSMFTITVYFFLCLSSILAIRYYDSKTKWYAWTQFFSIVITVVFTYFSTKSVLYYLTLTTAKISFIPSYMTTFIFRTVQLPPIVFFVYVILSCLAPFILIYVAQKHIVKEVVVNSSLLDRLTMSIIIFCIDIFIVPFLVYFTLWKEEIVIPQNHNSTLLKDYAQQVLSDLWNIQYWNLYYSVVLLIITYLFQLSVSHLKSKLQEQKRYILFIWVINLIQDAFLTVTFALALSSFESDAYEKVIIVASCGALSFSCLRSLIEVRDYRKTSTSQPSN